jgi:hypothetical protein
MDADELYGLPLDRFIAERGRLAKALRAEGRREDAAGVAALRKPSVAAWAVNQLSRTQRAAVDELLAAGDGLREAQSALLGGRGGGRDLRGAMQRERAAVDTLVGAARGLLSSEGHELSPTIVERVADTLHAAALSDEAREVLTQGRLERELRHVGLGVDGPDAPVPVPERAERERVEARKAARSAEAEARRRAERALRSLSSAQERREQAARALDEADSALEDARAEAESATREHEHARDARDARDGIGHRRTPSHPED